jgi:hypothetical protein
MPRMTAIVKRSRVAAITFGLMLGASPVVMIQQAFGFQAGTSSGGGATSAGAGAPLNLLSPSFIAPAPRTALPRGGVAPAATPAVIQTPAAVAGAAATKTAP